MPDVSGVVNSPLTLSCSLADTSITMAMYEFYKGDSLVFESGGSARIISSAALAVAGDNYTCRVSVTLDYLDVSSPLILTSTPLATVTLTSEPSLTV